MVRTGATFIVAMLVWVIWRSLTPQAPQLLPGRAGIAVAALYGLASVTFVTAVYNTSTANLVFILAFTTMFSAMLSWVFLCERPRPATFAAMAAMVGGVLIIVSDSVAAGNVLGDFLAACTALIIASAITVSRATRRDMGFTPLVGVILPFAVAAVMVGGEGYRIDAPWWILLNGAVVMPISFFCLATGPKYISGPEVAMFYLLETVLAPIWVWLIFSEAPSTNSLIGGSVLIIALVAHSVWQLLGRRGSRAGKSKRPPRKTNPVPAVSAAGDTGTPDAY